MLNGAGRATAPNPVSFEPDCEATNGAGESPLVNDVLGLRCKITSCSIVHAAPVALLGVSPLVHQIRPALRWGSAECTFLEKRHKVKLKDVTNGMQVFCICATRSNVACFSWLAQHRAPLQQYG